jgi:dihydroorotase-like cyclic amidohydrolase
MLPLLLTAVNEGRLTLPQVARLQAARAGEVFNLPGKGRIALGYDADLVLVDLAAKWTFDRRRSLSKSGENMRVFDGRPLHGKVISTLVRGIPVYHDGAITVQPGHGQFIRPNH